MAGLRSTLFSPSPSTAVIQLAKRGQPSSLGHSWRRNLTVHAQASSHTLHGPLHPNYNLLNSLPHERTAPASHPDSNTTRIEELKEEAAKKLNKEPYDPTATMKLIDTLQRLGIAYHFQEEISTILDRFYNSKDDHDLFLTSLAFRLLRQHSYNVPPSVFQKFMDKEGKFKESLRKDTWGMLSLYEASYLGRNGEDILSEAMEFSKGHLKTSVLSSKGHLVREIRHGLELPRHMRMVRLEARSYIEEYSKENERDSGLLELAALDFNMVQSLHLRELEEILRWWRELGLVEKLSFARDRPLECYLWTVGVFWEPHFSKCRIELTKAVAILLVVDDMYDSYGSLDELVLFTNAIQRWDLGAMEHLPEYMKICYMALYNTTNEIGYRVLKEHGWSITHHLRRTWLDIIDAFLVEAKWCSKGYVPTLEDYLENGVTTGGTYMALVHAFFLIGQDLTVESVDFLEPYPKIFSCSGRILRLWDDLGTSRDEQERGDVASSMECYMKENGVSSDEEARKHVRRFIHNLWKELNGELLAQTPIPSAITEACFNLSRTAQIIYQHGDDDRLSGVEDHIQSLIMKPIKLHDIFIGP
ncbi:probable terpene synthase 11 [Magnolia sinica]|uniref:probable terpene synthase 11 n=1 Tax=Magnolia sinica TaxID=86752 RepID=UPI0026586126|nr:probable terpene synthase 11 [Magnolia sinica]